jgi:hypothetical protein
MEPEENDEPRGREQSGTSLPRTSSAKPHATTVLVSSVGIPQVSIHAGNLILGDSIVASWLGIGEKACFYFSSGWLCVYPRLEFLILTVLQTEPRDMYRMFDKTPRRLVECISDLLKFDPGLRLTSQQCLAHEFLGECREHAICA